MAALDSIAAGKITQEVGRRVDPLLAQLNLLVNQIALLASYDYPLLCCHVASPDAARKATTLAARSRVHTTRM
jgi:hypothetical protein